MTGRLLPLAGAGDCRDLGRHRTAGGGRTRRGLVYRSDAPHRLTAADLAVVGRLGLRVVNRTSGGAFLPSQAYGVTRLGLVGMTMSLAQELAPFGIRVNAIAPGSVNTEAGAVASPPQFRAMVEATVPFPFGEPEDLVPGLLYLVSPGSDRVTGTRSTSTAAENAARRLSAPRNTHPEGGTP